MHRILTLAALLVLAAPLAAQEPPRPELPRDADPNDWAAYYDLGVRVMSVSTTRSRAAFYWASRLDPSRAEPLFARWASPFIGDPNLTLHYMTGDDPTIWRRPDILQSDSMRFRAYLRNPFVHRGMEILLWDQIPGYFYQTRENQAWVAYNEGKLDAASRGFTRLIEANPARSRRVRYWRALTYVTAAKYDSALADMSQILAELRAEEQTRMMAGNDTKEMVEYGIGMLHEAQGNMPAAREAFWRALVENAAFSPARAELGRLALAEGKADSAVMEYAQAVELSPDDGYLHLQHGQALAAAGKHAEALAAFVRARELEPHYAVVHLHMGVAQERAGAPADALQSYRRYLARAPRSAADQIARVESRVRALTAAPAAP
jgi:tetratricopeptide (TPR) repeat protein